MIGVRHSGHSPYRLGSTARPFRCGGKSLGGGIGGPVGAEDSAFAGDAGEYHHSRNLMKKMDMGRRTRRESSRSRGDARRIRTSRSRRFAGGRREGLGSCGEDGGSVEWSMGDRLERL